MGKYIGYRIGMDNVGTPVSTGETYDEAMSLAIRRVLTQVDLDSSIAVQEKLELTDDEFGMLKTTLDAFFSEAAS
jgi:hypothetical protein